MNETLARTSTSAVPIVDRFARLEGIEVVREIGNPWTLFVLIVFFLVLVRLSSMLQPRLARHGILPRSNRIARIVLRALVLVLALWLLVVLVPAWMGPALPWVLLGGLVLVVWSARDVLPDLMAGGVLRLERRVKPGVWVEGGSFAGIVHQVGIRATTLRDASERRVDVPNRALLGAPVASVAGPWPTHESTVSLPRDLEADRARAALVDAALASPWTPLEPDPRVSRDGTSPTQWRVRVRLLDIRHAARFDGELLERAEAILRRTPEPPRT